MNGALLARTQTGKSPEVVPEVAPGTLRPQIKILFLPIPPHFCGGMLHMTLKFFWTIVQRANTASVV